MHGADFGRPGLSTPSGTLREALQGEVQKKTHDLVAEEFGKSPYFWGKSMLVKKLFIIWPDCWQS